MLLAVAPALGTAVILVESLTSPETHAPFEQISLPVQGASQAPQCATDLLVSTHLSPQITFGSVQTHVPASQCSVARHAWPHSPQWAWLFMMSVQSCVVPHGFAGSRHVHSLATHDSSPLHAFSHPPQCFGCALTSTQVRAPSAPSHSSLALAEHTHLPLLHSFPGSHSVPHFTR